MSALERIKTNHDDIGACGVELPEAAGVGVVECDSEIHHFICLVGALVHQEVRTFAFSVLLKCVFLPFSNKSIRNALRAGKFGKDSDRPYSPIKRR